jgi:CRISPR-associated exonuclease Cas4
MSADGKPWPHHKYQLAAYGLLIDENYRTVVKRGYVDYVPDKVVARVDISPSVKTYVRRLVRAVRELIEHEELPPRRMPEWKCARGCGYAWICFESWQDASISRGIAPQSDVKISSTAPS